MLSVHWAGAEFALDHIINAVHTNYDGDKVAPLMPVSFNRKPPYLRKAFAAHPSLASHLARLEELMTEATEIAEQRAWCLHGFLDMKAPGLSLPITKWLHGTSPQIAKRPFSVKKIEGLVARTMRLNLNLIFFGADTVMVETQDGLNKIVRELFRQKGATLPEGKLPS